MPLILVLLCVLASPALSAPEYVKWTKTLAGALAEAKERGSMVLVCEVLSGEASNEAQMGVYMDPAFVKASRNFVCVFCNPEPTPEGEMVVDGEKITTSKAAPGVTSADHRRAYDEVQRSYADLNTDSTGATRFPFHFVADADGKVLEQIVNGTKEGGFDVVAADAFVAKLNALVSKFGKGLTADELAQCRKDLEAAKAAKAAGDLKGLLKSAGAVLAKSTKTQIADEARKLVEEASAGGEAALVEADGMLATDPAGALLKVEEVIETYAGTPVADKAKATLAEYRKRPEVKKAMAQVAARREAEKNLAKAEEELGRKQYARALDLFDDVAKKFPGTEQGEKAAARAAEIRGDESIAAEVREQQAAKVCKGWLSLGRTFAGNGQKDKAREQFEKVIREFPGTSYAAEAETELKKLR
jgi:tetratricopeptide (TPR) repeat protein